VVRDPIPIAPGNRITLLGRHDPPLTWHKSGGRLVIDVPSAARNSGHYAWTFKVTWAPNQAALR
jgi:alpha-L-fucosidase